MSEQSGNVVTWAALVGRWTEFARSAVALPAEGEAGRWREAVPHVITLQAVTHALGELDEVSTGERPLALDRAELACRDATSAIHELWSGEELPTEINELIAEARVAFEAAANAGLEWVVTADRLTVSHAADLVERLRRVSFGGELFVPGPDAAVYRGAPVVFARERGGAPPSEAHVALIAAWLTAAGGKGIEPERVTGPRQVYRQLDFATGRVVRDVVVGMHEPPAPGQPVLLLAMDGGEPVGLPPAGRPGDMPATLEVTFGAAD
ncbi:MAG: hypothetical protein AAF747_04655 [Planctomycetota bacterium]